MGSVITVPVKRLTLIAMMAVIICVCSWLTIPFTVPFTMQTFAVFLALVILGGRGGTMAVVIYVMTGVAGLPVFAGFQGGIGHILGPTGGYILGFIFMGVCYIFMEPLIKDRAVMRIISLAISLLICYLIGTFWFYFIYSGQGGETTIRYILSVCVLPYIIPDAIKLTLAVCLGKRIKKYI